MESENRGGGGGRGGENGAVAMMRQPVVVLRVMVMAFTLTAAVLLGIARETKTVPVMLGATLPPVNLRITTKWHYIAPFVFFVVANSITCSYVAMSLLLILAKKNGMAMAITLLDAVMVGLVFCGIGSAGTVGHLGYKGNRHVGWNKVCTVFQRFCGQAIAAAIISAIARTMLLVLVLIAIFNLYKKQERFDN